MTWGRSATTCGRRPTRAGRGRARRRRRRGAADGQEPSAPSVRRPDDGPRSSSVVQTGDQLVAADDPLGLAREPHLEAGAARIQHLVAGSDADASSPAATTIPDQQAESALDGMISPAEVSVSSSTGSIRTCSSSGSMRPVKAPSSRSGGACRPRAWSHLSGRTRRVTRRQGAAVAGGGRASIEWHPCDRTRSASRFVELFAPRGHVRLPSGSLVPPDWDTSVLITTAGMQPLKRYFLGADAAAGAAGDDGAEVLPHRRHRGGRQHRPASHLLRDDGQLLVRRLLQGLRRRVRVGAGDVARRVSRSTPTSIWIDRLRGRRAGACGRGGGASCGGASASRRSGSSGWDRRQLLAGRPGRSLRPLLGALPRPRPRPRVRPRRVRAGLRVRPVPGVLEPRLHAVQHAGGRRPGAAAGSQRRHRVGRRAGRRRGQRAAQRVRDRRVQRGHRRDRAVVGRSLRRRSGADPQPVHPRRSRPGHDLHGRRRHPALQRGPRIRASAGDPPGRRARPPDRHRGPGRPTPAAAGGVPDGRRVPRAAGAPVGGRRRAGRRGVALRADPADRTGAARRGAGPLRRPDLG